jgi:GntR family transcriptional regulator
MRYSEDLIQLRKIVCNFREHTLTGNRTWYIYTHRTPMLLHISDISQEPLHVQISRQIRAKILSGELKNSEMLPSIRVLAREQKVSPITVQKSYDDLINEGLILSKVGKGHFVVELTEEKKMEYAINRFKEIMFPILQDAVAGGLSPDHIKTVINNFFKNLE